VRTRPDGDHDGRVARGYLFICLQPAEPVLGTRGSSEAAMSQMVGVGIQVTRGGPGATPGRKAGAAGARGGPGAALSREVGAGAMETRGSPRAAPSRKAGVIVLT
jgi:hypothetical protein